MTEIVEATLNGAYTLKLPKHRADRPEWYDDHGWEKVRMKALVDVIATHNSWISGNERKPVVYYVGAEEGELCAILAMAGAELVLFEPNPGAWPNIKAVFEANNLELPYCFFGFAANQNTFRPGDESPMRYWPPCAGDELRGDHGFKELHSQAADFPSITIDKAVEVTGLVPDIITCDVEGSEFEVLRGAEQTILEHKPYIFPSIHPEFMILYWDQYSRDLRNWIVDHGYTEELLAWDHEAHFMYTPKS